MCNAGRREASQGNDRLALRFVVGEETFEYPDLERATDTSFAHTATLTRDDITGVRDRIINRRVPCCNLHAHEANRTVVKCQ